jgi:hypothetical protein
MFETYLSKKPSKMKGHSAFSSESDCYNNYYSAFLMMHISNKKKKLSSNAISGKTEVKITVYAMQI